MIKLDLFRNEDRYDEFKPGQPIFREADAGGTMHVVLQGNVSLSIKGQEVERLEAGGVLGEMALIDQRRFTFLIQQTPNLALQIMRVIADRLRRMDQKL